MAVANSQMRQMQPSPMQFHDIVRDQLHASRAKIGQTAFIDR